jgi:hypothetical protein
MSKLYQDAILDAKALRASAMANAKAALEEAFEPKIQEMLRLKLTEELEEDEALEEEMYTKDEVKHDMEEKMHGDTEENLNFSEAELEEILAELEELSKPEMEETLNEAEEDEDEEDAEEDEAEEEEVEGEEEVGDETKIIDITLGDLKQVLQSVMAGQQDMGMDIASDEADADSEAEAEISLDEILAELEEEGMVDKTMPEAEELKEKKKHDDKKDEVEKELEEAKSTIEKMRQDLQEVNLLNAKYLYMNKLFKSKSLTESQKVKVINALDRASSVTEVKNTYETLKESFSATKAPLKESIGFASQAAGVAPKANIVDSDPFVNRWKTLAGIK